MQSYEILRMAKEPRFIKSELGSWRTDWPSVKPHEISEVEIEPIKPIGKLPIVPCLYNAIMVQNPGHYARVYLVQWYRDILTMGQREMPLKQKKEIAHQIMEELKEIASHEDVWLDWDEYKTKNYVWGIVNKGYNAPSCSNILIPQGYCIGKCWRYGA